MLWPSISTKACSEYDTTLKIWCMAFPDLFPGGIGDFHDKRQDPVDIAYWARHMMMYKDGRFMRHKMFPFYVYNYLTRHRNKTSSNWFLKGFNHGNITSVSDIKEELAKGNKALLNMISYVC